ncbi:MAG: hypothetical protein ACE5JG_12080 [Planctomycetota bacterium]
MALDAGTGGRLAAVSLGSTGVPRPALWNRSLFVVEGGATLVEHRLVRKRFRRRWTHAVGAGASPPCVFANEIYVSTPAGLLRLRPGLGRPVWKAAGDYLARPALFDRHIHAVRRDRYGNLTLTAFDRATGEPVADVRLPHQEREGRGGRVVAGAGLVVVQLPPPAKRRWCLVKRTVKDGRTTLSDPKMLTLKTQPLVFGNRLLALDEDSDWVDWSLSRPRPFVLAAKAKRPHLVAGAASPVRFRGGLCFGSWTMDGSNREILWHVQEHRARKEFRRGVRYGAVRAGGLLLLVRRDGKALHAVAEERIGP